MASSLGSLVEQALLHRLASTTGRAVDLAYSAVVHQLGITQRFFPEGFGQLEVINFHEDVSMFTAWPPPQFAATPLPWQRVGEGSVGSAAYDVFRAEFPTPATGRVYDALPVESRTASALWVSPRDPAPGGPTVLHLAATGDHGFARRQHLGVPLVARGVGTVALESPFYGSRRPAGQQGAKLRRVSDLLLLGRVTIEESLLLLGRFADNGHTRLGISGLSMGGVHATMVASLYPGPIALTPLLAPRSAAEAYCAGALYYATAWDKLVTDSQEREEQILAAVQATARANAIVAESRLHAAAGAARAAAAEDAARAPAPREEVHPQPSPPAKGGRAGASAAWSAVGAWLSGQAAATEALVQRVRRLEGSARHTAAVELLEAVLEAYTDSTRFPRPQRPDAAVLVAATEDAYVSRRSVEELARHLPGSELRWVPGGHVSSFLLHQNAFRAAIADSLARL